MSMGAEYIEEGLGHPSTSAYRVETPDGFFIIERSVKMNPGNEVAFL